ERLPRRLGAAYHSHGFGSDPAPGATEETVNPRAPRVAPRTPHRTRRTARRTAHVAPHAAPRTSHPARRTPHRGPRTADRGPLLVPQRHQRIDLAGPARGQPHGEERDRGEQERHTAEHERIPGRHAEEERGDEPRETERSREADR